MRYFLTACTCLVLMPLFAADTGKNDATDDDLAKALRAVYETNIKASADEDVDKLTETLHPDSSMKQNTLGVQQRIFKTYDLKIELLSFTYLSTHDELAFVRLKQRNSKLAGPEYRNNTIDTLTIFKKDDAGHWKIFSQAALKVTYP